MKKIKRIFGVTAFLAIGLMLTVMTCYVIRPIPDEFSRPIVTGFYGEKDDTLDVVAFGSSALYCYLASPLLYEYTGLTSYPVATSGQSIYVIENLIDEVLKTQSPQLLVVEARKFLMTGDGSVKKNKLRLLTDNMRYSANRISLINKLVDGWYERLTFYFDIMLYHENWENVGIDSFSYFLNNRRHPLKGWKNNDRHKTVKKPVHTDETEEMPLSAPNEEVLLDVMEKCREKNLEVLFVASPFSASQKIMKRSNYMKRIVEEHGFRFLDCNHYLDEMGMDYSVDFFNDRHTNSIGADKFTKFLGEYILENYDMDTDHSPEVTAEWDKVAKENRVLYEQACEEIYRKVQEESGS